ELASVEADNARLQSEQRARELEDKVREQEAQKAQALALTPGAQIHGLGLALKALEGVEGRPSWALEAGIFAATRSLHDVRELPGHAGNIIDLAFAPDGKLLASAGRDGQVLLWDGARGLPRDTLMLGDEATHLEFSASGEWLLIVGKSGKAFVWPVAGAGRSEGQGAESRSLDPDCRIGDARFTPDGTAVALTCASELCLWSLADDQQTWYDLEAPAAGVAFTANQRLLVSAGSQLSLLDLASGERTALEGHETPIMALGVSADGSKFASADEGGAILLWDGASVTPWATLEEESRVERLFFSPDGGRLLVVADTPTLWRIADGRKIDRSVLQGHGAQVTDAAFSPDGTLVATVGYDQSLRLWDGHNGRAQAILEAPNALLRLAFSPTGASIATGEYAGVGRPMVRLWAVQSSTQEHRIEAGPTLVSNLSLDGSRVALADRAGIRVWDTAGGAPLFDLEFPGARSLRLSPSGSKLIAGDGRRWMSWVLDGPVASGEELPGWISVATFMGADERLVIADYGDRVGEWTSLSDLGPPSERRRNFYAALAVASTGMIAAA
ncbi:MAG: WD40 repeat domain-containing protein, partial [Myxococcales bacterium]|nr:WD40 repeat domain-containing protein [Myxococcales bacterium]